MAIKSFLIACAVLAVSSAQECGKLQNTNVDDKNANLPWTVQLRERMTNDLIGMGTLISNRHVLIGKR